jgi:hypothetical protein
VKIRRKPPASSILKKLLSRRPVADRKMAARKRPRRVRPQPRRLRPGAERLLRESGFGADALHVHHRHFAEVAPLVTGTTGRDGVWSEIRALSQIAPVLRIRRSLLVPGFASQPAGLAFLFENADISPQTIATGPRTQTEYGCQLREAVHRARSAARLPRLIQSRPTHHASCVRAAG